MNNVSDILQRKGSNTISVQPATPVLDALQLMADKNIGSVVVMNNDEYVGLVTERDYSRKVALKNKQSATTPVSEIMSTDLPHISMKESVEQCMELMTSNNIRYLPVFNNDNFVGIISMSDVVKQTILAQQQTITQLNSYIYS